MLIHKKILVLLLAVFLLLILCSCGEVTNEAVQNSGQIPDTASPAFEPQESGLLKEILAPVKGKPGTYQTVSTNGYSYFVVKNDDALWAWEKNTNGQLGIGTRTNEDDPLQREPVLVMENVKAVSTQEDGHGAHTLILKTDGTLWGAGTNSYGELGTGAADSERRTTPLYIMDDVISVCAGPGNSFAIKSDHSLWAWGDNGYGFGTLGNGTTEPQLSPVKVLDDVESVETGSCTFAVKTDGTLWAWGSDYNGAEDSTVPVQIMENVAAACIGKGCYGAIKTDGTLWIWGRCVNYNDPITPVYVLDDVAAINPNNGIDGFFALKNDGTLWSCDEVGARYYTSDKKMHFWDGIEKPEDQLNDLAAIDGDENAVWMIVNADGTILDWRNPLEYTPAIDNIKIS